jgi:hypothetical protein
MILRKKEHGSPGGGCPGGAISPPMPAPAFGLPLTHHWRIEPGAESGHTHARARRRTYTRET